MPMQASTSMPATRWWKESSRMVRSTRRPGADGEIGGFGGLFDLKAAGFTDPVLVAANDGVGTKLKVAIEAGMHDTVGIDLVAMCVNDLVVQGAEPLFFLDYFATGKLDPDAGRRDRLGHRRGLPPGRLRADRRRDGRDARHVCRGDYDLAGFAVGRGRARRSCCRPTTSWKATSFSASPRRASIPTAFRWCGGSSSSPASTGATRRRSTRYRTLGEALLTPTRIYVKPVLAAIRWTHGIKALAHITGGGFPDNIPRVLPEGFRRRTRPRRDRGAAGLLLARQRPAASRRTR